VRDDLRDHVLAPLGDAASGVLIVDETGFLKNGSKSCGVARQYTGTAGDTVNAQVGVFLAYASEGGAAFIDRTLYLPREWTTDRDRRAAAGIPKRVRFATKITLAQRMLTCAFAAVALARWVVADSGYGRSHRFRQWLEKRGRSDAVMVPKTNAIHYLGGRERVEQSGACLSEDAWVTSAADAGAQGERVHDWACLRLSQRCAQGMCRWLAHPARPRRLRCARLLARVRTGGDDDRGVGARERHAVADRAGALWAAFAQAKGEVGMDHYDVRTWTVWHRLITLCLVAHALLVVLRAQARSDVVRGCNRGMPNPS
jgi:SRSO17 transposase